MKIFWSWQSDTPEESGRYFVRDVLKYVAKQINRAEALEEAERPDELGPVKVDFDTNGVAGSPHIASTILAKIQASAVFVADVTPVGKSAIGQKLLANPNVMIELGYAINALRLGRIVLVMNEAEGATLDSLPFDLRHLRGPVSYCLAADADTDTRKAAFQKLASDLTSRLKPTLEAAGEEMRKDRRLSSPRPEFSTTLEAPEGELPRTISQSVSDLDVPSLDSIRLRHPLLMPTNLAGTEREWPRIKSRGFGLGAPRIIRTPSQWTPEEIQGYNKRLESYYRGYERYLLELAENRRIGLRTLRVALALHNDGTAPGTDIDVFVNVPASLQLYADGHLPEAPVAPRPPDLDPEPQNYATLTPYTERLVPHFNRPGAN